MAGGGESKFCQARAVRVLRHLPLRTTNPDSSAKGLPFVSVVLFPFTGRRVWLR